MRNFAKLTRSIYIGFITLLISLAWTNVYAGMVMTNPAVSSVELNDIFSVDIVAREFTEDIDGFGLDVVWDPSRLSLNSVAIDTGAWSFSSSEGDSTTTGHLFGVGGSTFFGNTGNFNLATLTFQAIGSGVTDIFLRNTMDPVFLWSSSGSVVSPSEFIKGSVEVSSVPLPAGVWLMLSGLSTLLIGSRRRQAVN